MAKKVLIVLDPGHYPKCNKGAATGYYEGDKMYTLSEYERDELKAYGFDVILTRERSKDMELYDRGQVAVKNGAGYDYVVFISNHSNGFNGTAYGVVGFRSLHLPKSQELGEKLVNAVVDVMKPTTKVTYSRGCQTKKNGIGADYYGVIRGSVSGATSEASAAKVPVTHSYIIEHGFHDHAVECAFLNVDANLKKLAEAEAKVIADYFGFKKPVVDTSGKTIYRVQVGAFSVKANADNLLAQLKKAGFNGFITTVKQ